MTNETLQTIQSRRSCRAYKPEQITNEELDAVLEAGTYAASAMGRQSAKIVVVQDTATRAQLTRMNAAVMGADSDPMYGAPTILVVLADAHANCAVQDGSLVMGNLMLRFNGVGALQFLHKGVQLLCGVVALVDLVPQLAGKVGGVVDVFGLCDQLVIRLHKTPYTLTM